MHGCRERLTYVRIAIVYTFRKYTRQHCMKPTCLHVFLFFVLVHLKYADYFLFSGYYDVLNELSFFDQKISTKIAFKHKLIQMFTKSIMLYIMILHSSINMCLYLKRNRHVSSAKYRRPY